VRSIRTIYHVGIIFNAGIRVNLGFLVDVFLPKAGVIFNARADAAIIELGGGHDEKRRMAFGDRPALGRYTMEEGGRKEEGRAVA
jgi:hypothetical protein